MSEQPIITYSEARSAGLKRYFTGKPCKQGHVAARHSASGLCVICSAAACKGWYAANKEKAAANSAAWRAAKGRDYRAKNKDRLRAQTMRWRASNMEHFKAVKAAWGAANPNYYREYDAQKYLKDGDKIRAYSKAWKAANQDRVKAAYHKWRSAKAGENYTSADLREITKMQKNKCAYCSVSLQSGRHIDHIVPLSGGGSNGRRNIQLCCKACNLAKHSKHPIAFARQIGRLV